MRYRNLFVGLATIGGFLVCSSTLFGITAVSTTAAIGEKSDKKIEPSIRVSKSTELMEKMENGVLYTERNQYKLAGVKILDLARNKKTQEGLKGRKRIVELTFIDKVLKEVVIHR